MDDPGFEGDVVVDNISDAVEELTLMVGTGATNPHPSRGKARIASGTGTAMWDTLARKNIVMNYDGRVAQRNVAGVITPAPADNGYGIDRWRLLLEAANAAVVSQETSNVPSYGSKTAMKLTAGSGNNNKFGHFEVFEKSDVAHLRGQVVSLQASLEATAGIATVKMAILEWTGTADAVSGDPISSWGADGVSPTLAANWAYLNTPVNLAVGTSDAIARIENVAVGSSMNNLAVFIWSDDKTTTTTTDFLIITDVQLEQGAVCTDVERRPIAVEVALCLRYFWRFNSIGNTVILSFCGFSSTTLARFTLYFTVAMRTAPTLTMSGASDLQVTVDFSTTATGTIAVSLAGVNYAAMSISSLTSTFVVGQAGFVRWVGTGSYIEFSAEL